MKHLIAIFSVILTLGVIAPSDGWGLACPATCAGRDCDANHDLIIGATVDDNSPLFQCGDGCGKGTFVAIVGSYYIDKDDGVRSTNDQKFLRVCDDPLYDNKWRAPSQTGGYKNHSITECSDALPQYVANSEFRSKNKLGNFVNTAVCDNDMTGCGVMVPVNGCYGWFCKEGYNWNSSSGKCEDNTGETGTGGENYETLCSKSHGNWTPPATCFCDPNKGLENTVPGVSRSPCRCKDADWTWNASQDKCIDPYAGAAEKCSKTGGDWDGINHKCECDKNNKGLTQNGNYECRCIDGDKEYSSADNICVPTAQAVCRNSGGDWDAGQQKCTCNINKNVKEVSGSNPKRCECINEDYEPAILASDGCKLTDEAERRIGTFNVLKNACEKEWRGTWTPADGASDDARDPDKWECTCTSTGMIQTDDKRSCRCDNDSGYVLDSARAPYSCRLSDYDTDKKNCDEAIAAGTDAIWQDKGVIGGRHAGDCVCKNNKQMYNYATKKCLDNDTVATWCAMIPGAAVTRDGRCLCRSTEREPVNYKCPTAAGTTSVMNPGTTAVALNIAKQKKERITTISNKLKEISDGFGRSHWKTASGNFNGARLASDSIAGVVLGTVGGVVTSNIIKKNQVKGGFENLSCTVGGQMVADYGDQFQVGVW